MADPLEHFGVGLLANQFFLLGGDSRQLLEEQLAGVRSKQLVGGLAVDIGSLDLGPFALRLLLGCGLG